MSMVFHRNPGALTAHPRSRDWAEEFKDLKLGARSGSAINISGQGVPKKQYGATGSTIPGDELSQFESSNKSDTTVTLPNGTETDQHKSLPPRLKFPEHSFAYVSKPRKKKLQVKSRYLEPLPKEGYKETSERTYREWKARHSPRTRRKYNR